LRDELRRIRRVMRAVKQASKRHLKNMQPQKYVF
jgi:hypothetical protein